MRSSLAHALSYTNTPTLTHTSHAYQPAALPVNCTCPPIVSTHQHTHTHTSHAHPPAAFPVNCTCPPIVRAPLSPIKLTTPPFAVARHPVALAKSENCTPLETACTPPGTRTEKSAHVGMSVHAAYIYIYTHTHTHTHTHSARAQARTHMPASHTQRYMHTHTKNHQFYLCRKFAPEFCIALQLCSSRDVYACIQVHMHNDTDTCTTILIHAQRY
jgi:hypothetical protein